MKFFIYIFAFYLLILPMAGLAGTSGCDEKNYNQITASSDTHSDEDAEENCSPVCNCACCFHIVSNNFQLQKLSLPRISYTDKIYAPYKNILLPTDFWGNIWQPPKASC
ncbi:DUF6660 family protein [Niabella ginsengisoli]|uniref:DUF6660 family protein n=1 Tax=Niabella ginsengisoli TaxID=522298 RepID=UPI00374DEC17